MLPKKKKKLVQSANKTRFWGLQKKWLEQFCPTVQFAWSCSDYDHIKRFKFWPYMNIVPFLSSRPCPKYILGSATWILFNFTSTFSQNNYYQSGKAICVCSFILACKEFWKCQVHVESSEIFITYSEKQKVGYLQLLDNPLLLNWRGKNRQLQNTSLQIAKNNG